MQMREWMMWLAVSGVLVTLEIFSGTFYLLMIALGAVLGACIAFFGGGIWLQIITAGLAAALATLLLRGSKWGKQQRGKTNAAQDPNVNLDIGHVLEVTTWIASGKEHYSARVFYRGAQWDVDLKQGYEPKSGLFMIREVSGSRLIVVPE